MRNLSIRISIFLVLIMVGVPYGCWLNQQPQGAHGNTPKVELLLKGTYGIRTDEEPAATWIKDQETLGTLYQKLNAGHGGKGTTAPQIDFKKFGVLFLEMGQKSSGGHAINFDPSKTQVTNEKLVLHVGWDVPAQGMTVTQAITSPFIMLKINKANITSILVMNQNNISRFESPIE